MEEPVEGLEAALQKDGISVLLSSDGEECKEDHCIMIDDANESNETLLPTAEVCRIIRDNMQNIERSLRCPLCLSCSNSAMMIGACCHVYCKTCILTALQLRKECPTCKQPCTKRALLPAPQFDELVIAYKGMLRNFGLAPAKFDPNIPITQLAPDEEDDSDDDDDNNEEEINFECAENVIEEIGEDGQESRASAIPPGAGKPRWDPRSDASRRELSRKDTKLPFSRRKRSSSSDWVNLHEHVQAARTFARHLKGAVCLHREQAAVVSVNERALVRAAVALQQRRQSRHYCKYQTIHVSLSQEIREQAQEQQAADALLLSSASLEVHGGSDEEDNDRKQAALPRTTAGEDREIPAATWGDVEPPAPMILTKRNEAPPQQITRSSLRRKMTLRISSGSKPSSPKSLAQSSIASETKQEPEATNDKNTTDPVLVVNPFTDEPETLEDSVAKLVVLRNEPAKQTGAEAAGKPPTGKPGVTAGAFLGDGEEDIERFMPCAQPQDSAYVPPCSGLDENSPSNTVLRRRDYFSIGSIVEVESRTWPGVNKQGGVGRVTRVHHQDNNEDDCSMPSVFYDIAYVLGGKETMVDAVFVSAHKNPLGRDREAGSLRLRFNNIPQSLLEQLEADGFDTVGRPSLAVFHNNSRSRNEKTQGSQKPSLSESPDAKRRHSEGTREGSAPGKIDQKLRFRAAKAKKVLAGKRSRDKDEDSYSELNCDRVKCQRADEHYQGHLEDAINRGVVNVITSSLSREDAEAVVNLCKKTKGAPVKVKFSDVLTKRTTLCVMPVQECSPPNVTARCRTLKSMRAALAGVPLVTTGWVNECLQVGQAMHPESSMFIRTLPSKLGSGVTDFGVAYMAGLIRLGSAHLSLRNCYVFLCGKYTRQVSADMMLLAREAGATILTQVQCVVPKIRMDKSKVVLLCNKSADSSLTETLSSECKQHPQNVLCVTAQWLFDSVSSGECKDAWAYPPEPECEVAKGLWAITTTAHDVGRTGYFGTTSF